MEETSETSASQVDRRINEGKRKSKVKSKGGGTNHSTEDTEATTGSEGVECNNNKSENESNRKTPEAKSTNL